jgi:hypothetical protein
MTSASCLCGAVTWRLDDPVPPLFHCHCSRCRKAHGTAFATYAAVPGEAVELAGDAWVARFQPAGADERCFCRRCGSVVPYDCAGTTFLPAGNFDDDPGARPALHMFTAARASWYRIADGLPRHPAFPPGWEQAPPLGDRPPTQPAPAPGVFRGSCLCGAVAYLLEGPMRRRFCHCARCRRSLSAAHATNLVTSHAGVRFTRGEETLVSYKIPEARHFTQVFCPTCGSPAPRRDPSRDIAVVPMGSLDDDPGVPASCHIFVAWKAPWFTISDDLPQHPEYPPSA